MLKDPLWYAAKWGGFEDSNNNDLPDLQAEWDENGDGVPDNYFLVTNALKLSEQLERGVRGDRQAHWLGVVGVGEHRLDLERYPRLPGEVQQRRLDRPVAVVPGAIQPTASLLPSEWDAAQKLNGQTADSRVIITTQCGHRQCGAVPLGVRSAPPARRSCNRRASDGRVRIASTFVRGDNANEQTAGRRVPQPRPPSSATSCPRHRCSSASRHSLSGHPGIAAYSAFVTVNANRPKIVYAGANDGMLHAFDAGTRRRLGEERLGFIPGAVFSNLIELTKPTYTHQASSWTARRRSAMPSTQAPGTRCWSVVSTRAARASMRSMSPIRAGSSEASAVQCPALGIHGS